ncbi:MAG: hypothetical protein M0Z53_01770 [Thermaerobacter sp.]|nr:hypothetical protein [Thermaerobacter sp.]
MDRRVVAAWPAQAQLHSKPRVLTRNRKCLIAEWAREANRVQIGWEGATLQQGSALADVLGACDTRILRAWARGETDPAQLAALADARIRAPPAELARAGEGLLGTHQQFLLTQQLLQHLTSFDPQSATPEAEVETRLAPFAMTRDLMQTHPGIGRRTARGGLGGDRPHRGRLSASGRPSQVGGPGRRVQANGSPAARFPAIAISARCCWKRHRRPGERKRRMLAPTIAGWPGRKARSVPR